MSSAPPAAPGRPPRLAMLAATGLGSGYAPVASGTFGTAACAVLLWPLRGYATPLSDVLLAAAFTAIAVVSSGIAARHVGLKDPGIVVADEFAGFAASLMLLPKTLPWFLAAFFLFRLFDVWKPWPCRRLELLPGGVGITADDVMAGLYVNAILHGCRYAMA